MNPFAQIIFSLQQALRKGATPQGVVQLTQQPTNPVVQGQLPLQLARGGGVPNFLTPQPNQASQGIPQPNTQNEPNPFIHFLQARGVPMRPQSNSGFLNLNQSNQKVAPQQNVMNGGFNAKNIVIPNTTQIRANLAMDGEKQGKGDLIV